MQGLVCWLVFLIAAAGRAHGGSGNEAPRYANEALTFLGYDCDAGCEQEKAGFAWAERHAVTEPGVCEAGRDDLGDGWARGCRAHAEESTTPEEAGERWAMENELGSGRWCDGAGPRFRAGCLGYVLRGNAGGGTNRPRDR